VPPKESDRAFDGGAAGFAATAACAAMARSMHAMADVSATRHATQREWIVRIGIMCCHLAVTQGAIAIAGESMRQRQSPPGT
jgi:hypothetical protein